jgi:MobA/MobL family/RepB DNA-primase from phage plasmid
MAIYHLTVRTGSRTSGQSAKAKADYIQREGKYACDSSEVLYAESGHMPEWAANGSQYWGAADLYERANGRLFKEIEFSLPIELTLKEQQVLVNDFVKHLTAFEVLPYTLAIHAGKGENPHVHLMISERKNDGIDRPASQWFGRYNAKQSDRGGAQKSESLKPKDWLEKTRESWADHANRALALAGHDARIDHRTLDKQGIERLPGIHLGPKVVEMENRGIRTDRADEALSIDRANSQIFDLQRQREVIENECNLEGQKFPKRKRISGADRATSPEHGSVGRGGPATDYGDAEGEREASRELVDPAGAGDVGMEDNSPGHESVSSGADSSKPECSERGLWLDLETMDGGVVRFDDAYSGAADRIVSLARLANSAGPGEPLVGDKTLRRDRTIQAIRMQLNAMGCDWYAVSMKDCATGKLLAREWTSQELVQSVLWLKRMNARGHDIYIRPAGRTEHGLVLVDELSFEDIARMKRNGEEPAVVLETRQEVYQAWVKVAEKVSSEHRNLIGGELARAYGGKLIEDGRLAGFTNQSNKNLKSGYYPWILCRESNGRVASNGTEMMIRAQKVIDSIKQTKEDREQSRRRGFSR